MLVRQIDLYEYHGQTREPGCAGTLTCYVPHTPEKVSACRRRPAVLILPGGAYRWVSGREGEPVALRFVTRGYAAFVLEYSCAPFGFPTSLREAAMAMDYIRKNAAEFGVDPHMVAAVGFSAGGHLCGTLGMMYDCPELADLRADARPDALCLCYPVAVSWGRTHEESFENISRGDPELRRRLSLDRLVRPDMPPVFLWHTRDDQSVPCRNSLVLAAALEAQGVDFEMRIYHHGQHGLSTADEMVYSAENVPETSRDIRNWPELAMEFFREKGLRIRDEEESK